MVIEKIPMNLFFFRLLNLQMKTAAAQFHGCSTWLKRHCSVLVCLLHSKQFVEPYSVFIAFSYFDNSFYYFFWNIYLFKGKGKGDESSYRQRQAHIQNSNYEWKNMFDLLGNLKRITKLMNFLFSSAWCNA